MSHSVLLKVSAIIVAFFGVVLLLAPNLWIQLYGGPALNSPGLYNTMLYGGVLISFAVMNWAAAGAPSAAQVGPVILGNLVADVLGLVVTLYLQLTDPVVPTAAWSNVAIFLVFSVLFGQAWMRLRPKAGAAMG